jgi:cobalt/nickel transport system permease protein
MATVIIAQALFLQDGGLLALGANIFNIGAITVFSGSAVFRLLRTEQAGGKHLALAGFAAGWFSLVLSAAACALQLALSNAVPLRVGLTAMTGYHAVIGGVEGALTAGVLSFLRKVRPDLLRRDFAPGFQWVDWAGGILLVAIPLGILVLAGGSSLPDPLQALLTGPASAVDAQAGPLLSDRNPDLYRVLVYLALFALCAAIFLAVRMIRNRKGAS